MGSSNGPIDRSNDKVAAVIVARDEAEHIGKTLQSLRGQTHQLEAIILVDDGSLDSTADIAREYGCHIISLKPHEVSLRDHPGLAERFNRGFRWVRENFNVDYVLIVGADHQLPRDYLDRLLPRMTGRVVVASGAIEGESAHVSGPRGSGRLIDEVYWRKADGMEFEEVYGWETAQVRRARQLGYETRCFLDIKSIVSRRTHKALPLLLGKSYCALGYTLPSVLNSLALRKSLRNLGYCAKVLFGWGSSRWSVKRSKTAERENLRQKRRIIRWLMRRLAEITRYNPELS